MIKILKNSLKKGLVTGDFRFAAREDVEKTGAELKVLIERRFSRSFHIREVDTGSCGACESEIISLGNPLYDIQRFGIDFVASPRHADALLVTGPVSRNMEIALRKTWEAMPGPKLLITLGDCALDGGPFKGSYYTLGGARTLLPVTLHIPGCPPKPIDVMSALIVFLKK